MYILPISVMAAYQVTVSLNSTKHMYVSMYHRLPVNCFRNAYHLCAYVRTNGKNAILFSQCTKCSFIAIRIPDLLVVLSTLGMDT